MPIAVIAAPHPKEDCDAQRNAFSDLDRDRTAI
jgi:hypothetical protein